MFGDRLKLARKKAGFSLRTLSEALDSRVSAQAIGKYERGAMMPSSGTLLALAKTLDVSLDYLMGAQIHAIKGLEFRKKSGTSAKDRARVEAAVIEHVERYLTIEDILDLDSAEWHCPVDKQRIESIKEAATLAKQVREAWQLGENPIPDMTELLEKHGLKVLMTPLPDGVSGMTCMIQRSGGLPFLPVIVVNQKHPLERRRLTLAHELGHRLIADSSPVEHEKAATYFAGAFLVPENHLKWEIGKHRKALGYAELVQLKRMYRVSAAALLARLRDVGIIAESTLAYAFKTFANDWRRKEPDPLEEESQRDSREPARRFERLCYWALAEKLISPSKASELLQRPLQQIEIAMKGPAGENASYRE
ncbi:MAG: XRE family transcriptional regulator [Candidatus Tectomicrobia bacterium]|nr:XRE family transcriptional regulator [Candidatus Tectomicrobia bacterium]